MVNSVIKKVDTTGIFDLGGFETVKKIFFGEAQQLEFFERLSKRLFGEAQQLQKTGLRGLEAYDSSFHDEAWVHQGQE